MDKSKEYQKICPICKKNKCIYWETPLEHNGMKKMGKCYSCNLKSSNDWRKKNRNKIKEYNKMWFQNNKDKVNRYKRTIYRHNNPNFYKNRISRLIKRYEPENMQEILIKW